MAIVSINPATGELLRSFEPLSQSEIEGKLRLAAETFPKFRRLSFADRAKMMSKAADILEGEKEELARLMTTEMGKTFRSAVDEAVKCATGCRYYAKNAERFLADEVVETGAASSFIRYQPLGVILAVMPWNFPFWQVFRFAAPALAAGNGAILKHAPNVCGAALEIERLLREAGFPEGLFRAAFLENAAVAAVIADPRVRAVTLTGSERAGSAVGAEAGRHVKKTVLELGGSDPFIVLEDADLTLSAAAAAEARLQNSGQSCIAAKRFIVVERIADRFLEHFTAEMQSRRVGDPLDPTTQVGPQARLDLRANLHRQVEESVARGARLVLGGRLPAGRGAFYPPTVLVAVAPGMPAFDEETFGPVAAVVRAKNEADAVRIANASPYGLGASVWTADAARGERLAPDLEAGSVFVNGIVKSDPRLPFGGVKRSGYGRELSEYGLREFVDVKTVWVA